MNYGILFFPIFVLLIYGYFKQKNTIVSINKSFLFVSIVPIVILHLALLNYSGHDFTSLYATIVLSILGGMILLKLSKLKRAIALNVILVLNIGSYYFVNRPGDHSWKGDLYATSMNEGLAIKEIAEEDKTIFYLTNDLDPMVIVYAERNIVPVRDESEIEQYLEELKIKDWQFIRLDK